jgi:hypothetical protein
MGMAFEPVSAANSETGREELYIVLDGERVGYRGHPGSADAGKWVSLVEGLVFLPDDAPEPSSDLPIIECGEVQVFEEPKNRVQ